MPLLCPFHEVSTGRGSTTRVVGPKPLLVGFKASVEPTFEIQHMDLTRYPAHLEAPVTQASTTGTGITLDGKVRAPWTTLPLGATLPPPRHRHGRPEYLFIRPLQGGDTCLSRTPRGCLDDSLDDVLEDAHAGGNYGTKSPNTKLDAQERQGHLPPLLSATTLPRIVAFASDSKTSTGFGPVGSPVRLLLRNSLECFDFVVSGPSLR